VAHAPGSTTVAEHEHATSSASAPWLTIAATATGAACGLLVGRVPVAREVIVGGALAVASLIDLRTRRIPNWLTAATAAFAITSAGDGLTRDLLGGAAAGLVGLALIAGSRGNYGVGDVKAMTVSGLALGIWRVPAFVLAMSCSGALIILILAAKRRRLRGETLAYGPAIALGYALSALFA
jgi:Flp pilus assembly protein protease CpaA